MCHLQIGTQFEELQIDLLFSPCGIYGQSTLPFMNCGGSSEYSSYFRIVEMHDQKRVFGPDSIAVSVL